VQTTNAKTTTALNKTMEQISMEVKSTRDKVQSDTTSVQSTIENLKATIATQQKATANIQQTFTTAIEQQRLEAQQQRKASQEQFESLMGALTQQRMPSAISPNKSNCSSGVTMDTPLPSLELTEADLIDTVTQDDTVTTTLPTGGTIKIKLEKMDQAEAKKSSISRYDLRGDSKSTNKKYQTQTQPIRKRGSALGKGK
jgi:hypothetical protein